MEKSHAELDYGIEPSSGLPSEYSKIKLINKVNAEGSDKVNTKFRVTIPHTERWRLGTDFFNRLESGFSLLYDKIMSKLNEIREESPYVFEDDLEEQPQQIEKSNE